MSAIKKLLIVLILNLLFIHMGFATPITRTLLTLDMANSASLPRNFRTTDHRLGFTNLKLVGTSQFSEKALLAIINELQTNNIIDIDLRQESHGFINGNAISWYGPQDASNARLSNAQIVKEENRLLNKIKNNKNIILYQILSKNNDGFIDQTNKIILPIYKVTNEQDLVKKYKLTYFRLYIQDFHAPSNAEVDRFISFMKQLPTNHGYLLFHCHAGVGRTTVFMVMADMLSNSKHLSFDEILTREAQIGGKDLREISPPNNFKYKFDLCRLDFLKRFYQYAQTNTDQFNTPWSTWNNSATEDPACHL